MNVKTFSSSLLLGAALTGVLCILVGWFSFGFSVDAAALSATNVQPATLTAGAFGVLTVTFTTVSPIPADGIIQVVMPSGYDINDISEASCVGIGGSITEGSEGNVLSWRRGGDGDIIAPGPQTCTMHGVRNPIVAGATGTYTVRTMTYLEVAIDTDAAVSSDTIVAAVLSGADVALGSPRPGALTTVNVAFTANIALEFDGKIYIIFPEGFSLDEVSDVTCTNMDGGFDFVVFGMPKSVVITRTGGGSDFGTSTVCSIVGVRNPETLGATGTYTITLTDSADGVHETNTAVAGDFTHRSSSAQTVVTLQPSLSVLSPQENAVFDGAQTIPIAWETAGGTFPPNFVDISYSIDGGATWVPIALHEQNRGLYEWTPVALHGTTVNVQVESTDLLSPIASDTSGFFTVKSSGASDSDSPRGVPVVTVPAAHVLPANTYIKFPSVNTVYVIDDAGARRPFVDEQTFFTYVSSFDSVVVIPNKDASLYPLGLPMTPNTGTVLIKIAPSTSVYVLEANNVLRWIPTEDLAVMLYGANWMQYVIDIPPTLWGQFTIGTNVSTANASVVDHTLLRTRSSLNGE